MWFFLDLYLQQVLGHTAFPSGAAMLPMTIVIMLGVIVLAPRLIARFGPNDDRHGPRGADRRHGMAGLHPPGRHLLGPCLAGLDRSR